MANEQMGLEGILNDPVEREPQAPATPDPAAEPAAKAEPQEKERSHKQTHRDKEQLAQGRIRDPETGQYAAKPDAKAADPAKADPAKAAPAAPEEMTLKEKAAFAKAADETRKRQALERELSDLRARSAPPPPPQEPAKTFWDDPEGALNRQRMEVQTAIIGTRLNTSETIARARHQDFEEKVQIFSELAMKTPGLADQMLSAPDPAEFVYGTARAYKELRDAGGLEQMRAKMEQETEARLRTTLEKEYKDKADAAAKERAALPGSLSDAQNKGSGRTVWSGPMSLENILGGK